VKLADIEAPPPLVQTDLRRRVDATVRQLAARGVDIEQFLAATGQDGNAFVEGLRPESEQAVKLDLALRAVAAAENIEADDDEVAAEYRRVAVQTGQKEARVRAAYENAGADAEIRAGLRKSKALDWLVHHVELVDAQGNSLDRDLVLDHDHDHDDEEDGEAVASDSDNSPDDAEETETAT
jgi:trigger factor